MADTKTSNADPKPDEQVRATAKLVADAAGMVCVAALVLAALVVGGWVIAAWTVADHDVSQTAASWVQAIGVPLAIVGTVWGALHQSASQRRAKDEKKQRDAADQQRQDLQRQRSALVHLHSVVEATAQACCPALNILHDEGYRLEAGFQAWARSADIREKLQELSWAEVPSSVQRALHHSVNALSHVASSVARLEQDLGRFREPMINHGPRLKAEFVDMNWQIVMLFGEILEDCAKRAESAISTVEANAAYVPEASAEKIFRCDMWFYFRELRAEWTLDSATAIAGIDDDSA